MKQAVVATLRRVALLLPLAVAVGSPLAACSAVLNWDANGLPCDTNAVNGQTYFCQSGYSCRWSTSGGNQCLRNASLQLGDYCTQGAQCGADLVCPIDLMGGGGRSGKGGIYSCLDACDPNVTDEGFLQPDGCSDRSRVCLPYLDQKNTKATKGLVGGCLPSAACTPGSTCSLNATDTGLCVSINDTAQACMTGCEVSWSTTQVYSDNCDALHSCVPVGAKGVQDFVCLYNGVSSSANPNASVDGQTVGKQGDACAPVTRPCAKGYVCSQGICAQYCQITTNQAFPCPTGQSCCPFTDVGSSSSTGFCSANCTGS